MLTASHIKRYGITATYDRYSKIDRLFSETSLDPYVEAELFAFEMTKSDYYDISIAIGADGSV